MNGFPPSRSTLRLQATLAALCLAGLAACASSGPSDSDAGKPWSDSPEALAAQGREIAVSQCSRCHALDGSGASPHAEAPPMSRLLASYDQEMLTNDLIEGIRLGHNDMPLFDFDVRSADALVAYLRQISE